MMMMMMMTRVINSSTRHIPAPLRQDPSAYPSIKNLYSPGKPVATTRKGNKNSSGDEIANVNFYAVRPEGTRIR